MHNTSSLEMIMKILKVITFVVFFVWLVDFSAWYFIGLNLGGYAYLGKIEGGRYYLGSHGGYTEVSQEVFRYSESQGLPCSPISRWRAFRSSW
jgi:hypothetical protein